MDEGHRRAIDLGVELPRSSLDAVMAHEVWEESYDRLEALITAHRTTLVFVNTRRMAERLRADASATGWAKRPSPLVHGSLSKEERLSASAAEVGALRRSVAAASLELGMNIGHVDIRVSMGSPTALRRCCSVAAPGTPSTACPRGGCFRSLATIFIEIAALLRAMRRGELDAIVHQRAPLDVLAQQVDDEMRLP